MAEGIVTSSWFGLYKAGWKGEIVPEAFSHPAKFSRGLIRKIYEYAIERGYLWEGAVVVDPFDGVALGALDAMFHGLHHVGIELEEKFVSLGQQNIDLWNRRSLVFKLRRWGTAVILRGDSRRLCEVLEGARAEGIIASPPYAEALSGRGGRQRAIMNQDSSKAGFDDRCQDAVGYSSDPSNLGNMPTGEPPSAIVSSPPFTDSQQVDNRKKMPSAMSDTWRKRFGQITDGIDPANLGNMPTGEPPQAVIGSPPHIDTLGDGKSGIDWSKQADRDTSRSHGWNGEDYGRADGQLAAMREGDVGAVIASPPYIGSEIARKQGDDVYPEGRKKRRASDDWDGYGIADGQLAALPEGEPPQAIAMRCPYCGSPLTDDDSRGESLFCAECGEVVEYVDAWECVKEGEPPRGIVSSPPWYGTTPESGDPKYAHKFHGDQSECGKSRYQLYNEYTYMSSEWIEERRRQSEKANLSRLPPEAKTVQTFWSAAKTILLQCHAVLAPGGVAIWVLKAFVRGGKIIDFPGQWQSLCKSCGFETVEVIRAWLVEERGTQYDLKGEAHTKIVERKSFFRRLAEKKGSPRIDYEIVLVTRKT